MSRAEFLLEMIEQAAPELAEIICDFNIGMTIRKKKEVNDFEIISYKRNRSFCYLFCVDYKYVSGPGGVYLYFEFKEFAPYSVSDSDPTIKDEYPRITEYVNRFFEANSVEYETSPNGDELTITKIRDDE